MKTDGAVHSNMKSYLHSNLLYMGRKTPTVLKCIKFIDDQDPTQPEIQEIIMELEILHDNKD